MTKISDERLADAEWLEHAASYFEKRDTGGEDMAFWANVANAERCRSIAQSLRAQGGVRVDPALLQGICDSLLAAIHEYEDRDMFPGARTIMQAQLDAILSSLEASPAPVSEEITDKMVKAASDELWARLDLNGHTGDGVRLAARMALVAALAAKGGQ